MEKSTLYPPIPQYAQEAHIPTAAILAQYRETALQQNESFWAELAKVIKFDKNYQKVLNWSCPKASWFEGGKLNVSKNCLDKNVELRAHKKAIIWEGENYDGSKSFNDNFRADHIRKLSYQELLNLTCQIANTLKQNGIEKGDRVAIYMPMTPEIVATMQACARIGAIHTVIFAGFSAQSIADRLVDCNAKMIVTADGSYRKGKFLELKKIVDQALDLLDKSKNNPVEKVLVYQRDQKQNCPINNKKDLLWKDSVEQASTFCSPQSLESEDPLFILYTSGTTGKPKGLYHTQAGYLLWAHWSTRWIFDLKEEDTYWCTADCGWITGHTYVAYGPLSNGATVFMYEGAPTQPDPSRFWQMIDRHKISTLYTAPTAIRMFMGCESKHIEASKLDSLRTLGTVGEPINPEAWKWFYQKVGKEKCPIVDTWWQTETGGAMISPLPGASTLKPGSASKALPGINVDVVDPKTGESCPPEEKGALVIKDPWPSMARGIWGDEDRFEQTYWRSSSVFDGVYLTGDFAYRDQDGDIWITGRMDDVLNIAGHRLGTAEVESALVLHEKVNEAAAVGVVDEIKGQKLVCYLTLNAGFKDQNHEELEQELKDFVVKQIGAHARPAEINVAAALPKTRSGKIMRRLLREYAVSGEIKGDTSTLEDFSAKDSLSKA